MGIAIGNVVSVLIDGVFVFPTFLDTSINSSLFSCWYNIGIYPAIKASKLSPVEALRYN